MRKESREMLVLHSTPKPKGEDFVNYSVGDELLISLAADLTSSSLFCFSL